VEPERFIPGFVEGMIGMKPEETRELKVDFPEDYSSPDLAGCAAKFSMTVHEIKERELPALDDDFAKEISDGEYETIAALQEMLEARYTDEAADKTKQNKETAILNELLTQVEVDLPETLIDREIESMLMQSAYQLQQQGIDVRQLFNQDTMPRLKESSRPEAINRLKRTMALGEVAKQQKLEVTPTELNDKIKETMEEMGDQTADVDPERLRSVLSEELLKEKILGWIEENSTIELVAEGSLAPAVDDEDDEPEKAKKKADKKADEKPKSEKKAEEKPKADEKPKAEKKAEEKPKADKKADEKPKAEKKAEEKPKADKKADEKPKAEKKAEEKPKADKKAPTKKKS
jgi:trigger factor